MNNVINCEKCNRIFLKFNSVLCEDCFCHEKKMISELKRFLRKQPVSTIDDVLKNFELTQKRFFELVKTKAIILSDDSTLGYPCNACGDLIKTGKVCSLCSKRIQKDIEQMNKEDLLNEQMKKRTFHSN